jgi:hypothetical protein
MARTWSIQYNKIASRFDQDQLAIFCLPVQSAYLLLSVTERLKWHSSYSDVQASSTELDAIQAVVELTEKGLMDYKTLDDIYNLIEEKCGGGPDYSEQLEALDALAALAQLVAALEPEILYLYYGVKALAEIAGPADLPELPSGE